MSKKDMWLLGGLVVLDTVLAIWLLIRIATSFFGIGVGAIDIPTGDLPIVGGMTTEELQPAVGANEVQPTIKGSDLQPALDTSRISAQTPLH